MLNTFDNAKKKKSGEAERQRQVEAMNESMQIATGSLAGTAAPDAVDNVLNRMGMSMPITGTASATAGLGLGAGRRSTTSGGASHSGTSGNSLGTGSDGDDEASDSGSSSRSGASASGKSASGKSIKSAKSSDTFSSPQFTQSFSAGMHAPPLGATEDAKRFLWDDDDTPTTIPSRGFPGGITSTRDLGASGPSSSRSSTFGASTRKLAALAPIELTPDERRRNLIDPKALPSALAAQGGMFNVYEQQEESGSAGTRIRARINRTLNNAADTLANITTSTGATVNTAVNNSAKAWKLQKNLKRHQSEDVIDYNINLHTLQNESDIFSSASGGSGGSFPGQVMLNTTVAAVSSACDSPPKRKRLCIVLACAAIVTLVGIGAGNSDAIVNALPSLSASDPAQDLEKAISDPRFASIRTRIRTSGVSDPATLLPTWPPSPQFQAIEWLTDGDDRQLSVDDEFLLQRYALATFWISTYGVAVEKLGLTPYEEEEQQKAKAMAGDDEEGVGVEDEDGNVDESKMWTRRDNWMTGAGICSWEGIECHHRPGGHHSETHYDEVSEQCA